jgi:hypothetical protein
MALNGVCEVLSKSLRIANLESNAQSEPPHLPAAVSHHPALTILIPGSAFPRPPASLPRTRKLLFTMANSQPPSPHISPSPPR